MNRIRTNPQEMQDLYELEAQLAGTLRPVQPSGVVLQRLRGRIRFPQGRIARRLNNWRSLYFALGSVLSGMLLLITVARALYSLVGRRAG